ncbi:GntR family phosphonate transport system transcriptional regulator [Rhizobium paknamense]|uniref:GntR family phosphonate transport system transcriptional regulator n=1 Tax=Rhizobium paknamense TaxID=1206817 RepID=A0ABU0IF35_9HYPH|nr:GntR family phosphonate transport system transcriptional regulator [Rhizobium paknamense]
MIERQRGVALWRQIADRIRSAIAEGAYDGEGKLPPELVLAEGFGVNRHTVRAAIAALQQEGIVQAVQGRGTLVRRRDKYDFPISRRTRFTEGLGDQVRDIEGLLLNAATESANAECAKWLDVPVGTPLKRLEVLRRADGRALSRSTLWFPLEHRTEKWEPGFGKIRRENNEPERFSAIDDAFRQTGSITAALARCGVPDYLRQCTEISAVHAEPQDVADLGLTPGAIVLVAKALNTDLQSVPIQFAVTRFPADRVQFTIRSDGLS